MHLPFPYNHDPNPLRRHHLLASPDLGARGSVSLLHGVVQPNKTRITSTVSTRDRHQRAGCSSTTSTNLNLGTRQIDLSTTSRLGLVQGDAFDADEVLAAGDVLGDDEVDDLLACCPNMLANLVPAIQETDRDIPRAGHVQVLPDFTPSITPTLNHTLPAASQVLMLALSGTRAM